ncbi:unnamed protein product [Paramecium primaurelia]|uniref:Uncharacterized protein n=1 Tax=Paramecium primaurelia TaxID=5886 RepID=A0A8S1M9K7_PARPR|nr:unnamed protein product [Paramecium primaurelia]
MMRLYYVDKPQCPLFQQIYILHLEVAQSTTEAPQLIVALNTRTPLFYPYYSVLKPNIKQLLDLTGYYGLVYTLEDEI